MCLKFAFTISTLITQHNIFHNHNQSSHIQIGLSSRLQIMELKLFKQITSCSTDEFVILYFKNVKQILSTKFKTPSIKILFVHIGIQGVL